jgi:hypothetical protein
MKEMVIKMEPYTSKAVEHFMARIKARELTFRPRDPAAVQRPSNEERRKEGAAQIWPNREDTI